ncbi:MAG: MOSC domain-containing protein [Bacteroidota bacterium]
MNQESPMRSLLDTLPQVGTVTWVGIRTERRIPLQQVDSVLAQAGTGLEGDHFSGRGQSKRQVTLISAEHIRAAASMLHQADIDPSLLRRNIVINGINLLALKDKQFQVGDAVLEMSGLCHPCSRMEENLGTGGYNAMRGHGGITARVVKEGLIRVGDGVKVL